MSFGTLITTSLPEIIGAIPGTPVDQSYGVPLAHWSTTSMPSRPTLFWSAHHPEILGITHPVGRASPDLPCLAFAKGPLRCGPFCFQQPTAKLLPTDHSRSGRRRRKPVNVS